MHERIQPEEPGCGLEGSDASGRSRVEFRPTAQQKSLFERAATLEGRSLTGFLIASAEERAHRIIEEHDRIALSEEARAKFIMALLQPPGPNEKLTSLLKRYAREVDSR